MSHETDDRVFNNYKKLWEEQINNLNSKEYNIEFKFLYTDEDLNDTYVVDGNKLISKCEENYWFSLLLKVLNGFDYFIKNDFDLVFKTNLSTFINFKKFYEYCKNINKERKFIYDGNVGSYSDFNFCSGAGMLLNKNAVNLILNHKNEMNDKWTDDIFFGYVLNKLNGIRPNEGRMIRFDIINSNAHFNKLDILNSTHIRIKVRENDLDIKYSNIVNQYLKEN